MRDCCARLSVPKRSHRKRASMSEAVNALFSDSVSIGSTTPLSADEKIQRYVAITPYINGLLADDAASGLALMSSVLSVLHNAFETYFWTGFYRRVSDEVLEVGPTKAQLAAPAFVLVRVCAGQLRQHKQPKLSPTCTRSPTTSVAMIVHKVRSSCRCSSKDNWPACWTSTAT